ncbi:hypothetical protein HK105_201523 [Polyrhizophydium stewartii]|uniref:Cell division cycle protein 123 n=1 Tax=Polyrhizophydium stewartii TaxID=2732419 RepID=A0ABR4NGW2_9FUNG
MQLAENAMNTTGDAASDDARASASAEAERPPAFPGFTRQHVDNCAFSSWYSRFERSTLPTRIIRPLPAEFVAFLEADGIVLPGSRQAALPLPRSESSGVYEVDSDIESESKPEITSDDSDDGDDDRSDVAPEPSFPDLEAEISSAIAALGGAVFPKLNWSSPRDAAWIAFGSSLKCTKPADVFLLLKSSDFVAHDLAHAYKDCLNEPQSEYGVSARPAQFELVLREWFDLAPSMEFRCFVRDNELVGITQRDTANFYEFLVTNKDWIRHAIQRFFESKISGSFPDSCYVFDVYVNARTRKVWLIDFNPFGPTTDTLLFTWGDILASSACQMRIVESQAQAHAQGQPSFAHNRMPREAFQLSDGASIEEFADRFRREIIVSQTAGEADEARLGEHSPDPVFVRLFGDSHAFQIPAVGDSNAAARALRTVGDLADAAAMALLGRGGGIDGTSVTVHLDEHRARAGVRLRLDQRLDELPTAEGEPRAGSTKARALVVKAHQPSTQAPSRGQDRLPKAQFEFLRLMSSNRPFKRLELSLLDGRINVDDALGQIDERAIGLLAIGRHGNLNITRRPDGLSEQRFAPNKTHRLHVRQQRGKTVKRHIPDGLFQKYHIEGDLETLLTDFVSWDIAAFSSEHWKGRQMPTPPDALLELYDRFHTHEDLSSFESCHMVVSAVLRAALDAVAVGKEFVFMEENLALEHTFLSRRLNYERVDIEYSGRAEYALGHSATSARSNFEYVDKGSIQSLLGMIVSLLETSWESDAGNFHTK